MKYLQNPSLPLARVLIACAFAPWGGPAQAESPATAPALDHPQEPLVNSHMIDADLATTQPAIVGSYPFNMILAPGGKFAITTSQGSVESLCSIDVTKASLAWHLDYPSRGGGTPNGLYYGLAAAADGTFYAAQGNADSIVVGHIDDQGKLSEEPRRILTRKGDFPSGLALDEKGRLYVANNDSAAPPRANFETPGSIAVYDAKAGKEIGRFSFTESFGGTPNFPLAVAVLRDGSRLYVASQRDSAVYVLDTTDPAHIKLAGAIPSGSHPIALLLDKSQLRLFVANADSDTVSILDTRTDKIIHTILMRPEIAKDVAGATPTGLALSSDEKRLYVTLGDMNAVGVVDTDDAELLGYLPAGWYPTAVVVSPDNSQILVLNAKGVTAQHPNPPDGARRQVSPLSLIKGNVINVAVPSSAELKKQTERVLELDRLTPRHLRRENPLAAIGLQAGKIKHVIYIVKENRTYDQILGDLPQGNGDPKRCLFGKQVTPNLHAIAERFVLLDNFYDCGEVSGDGWNWSTQAHANEYIARNVPYSYAGRGREYDYEGVVNNYPVGGFPAKGLDGKPLSDDPRYKNGAQTIPDVGQSPGGHIWDIVRAAKLSYRNFGFYQQDGLRDKGKTVFPENYPSVVGLQPGGHDLEGVSDLDFRHFDLNYADSDAPARFAREMNQPQYLRPVRAYGIHNAPSRFSEWRHEFQKMLEKSPDGDAVPAFMTVRFGDDHTMGTNPNHHSPRSMVADNDYAVGQLVDAISHSPIWDSSAIFVIEDDAQNGPDHVDAHRSICLVISPWIKAHSVDHTFQNTASVLKTIELLLGLPPMSIYDAASDPIMDWDKSSSNDAAFDAILPDKEILVEVNGKNSPKSPISPEQKTMMDESSKMNFAQADKAPADRLNQIIWKSVKGDDSVMPPTPRGPTPLRATVKKDDDD
jgi:YVTN family beta-propeller protein